MRAARALHARCLGLVVRAKLLRGGAFLVICPRIFCLILVLAHFLPAIFDLFVLAVCPRTLCTVQDKYQLLGMINEFCKRVYMNFVNVFTAVKRPKCPSLPEAHLLGTNAPWN